MAKVNIKMVLNCEIRTVWNKITSMEDYGWRSDLDKIEVLEKGKKFAEYTKDGVITTFTVTAFEPCSRYEFNMENDNMEGRWIGKFSQDGERTIADLTEDVNVKKWFMKPLAGPYLKKQQARYMQDLKRELEK